MSERQVVSIQPAVADSSGPGIRPGDQTANVLFVIYSDGSNGYRCLVCEKEFDKFSSCYAHWTHHNRTKESYQWDRKAARNKSRPSPTRHDAIVAVLIDNSHDLAWDIENMIAETSDVLVSSLYEQIDTLKAKLDEERKARTKAEKDLNRIRNLFKS